MKITLDEFLDHSFCVSMQQADYELFAETFRSALGVDKAPRRVRGLALEDDFYPGLGTYAVSRYQRHCRDVSLTHLAMIQAARVLDWPYIFIFEDSGRFERYFADGFKKSLENIPDDVGIIRYGCKRRPPEPDVKDSFYTRCSGQQYYTDEICVNGLTGSKGYCVFQKAYDRHIELYRLAFICDQAGYLLRPWLDYPVYRAPYNVVTGGMHSSLGHQDPRSFDVGEPRYRSHVGDTGTCTGTFEVDIKDFLAGTNQYLYEVHDPCNRPPNKHIKSYSGEVYFAVMGAVAAGDAIGYDKVVVNDWSRNTRYIVESRDFVKVMGVPDKGITRVSEIDGVKTEGLS
jgi:hypothetical protein